MPEWDDSASGFLPEKVLTHWTRIYIHGIWHCFSHKLSLKGISCTISKTQDLNFKKAYGMKNFIHENATYTFNPSLPRACQNLIPNFTHVQISVCHTLVFLSFCLRHSHFPVCTISSGAPVKRLWGHSHYGPKTHTRLKRTLFNCTKQDKTCIFSRKLSFSKLCAT